MNFFKDYVFEFVRFFDGGFVGIIGEVLVLGNFFGFMFMEFIVSVFIYIIV